MNFIKYYQNLNIAGKIKYTLLATVLVCTVVSLAWSYVEGRKYLYEATENRLAGIRATKKAAIEDYFHHVKIHLETLADDPVTVDALSELAAAFFAIPDSVIANQPAENKEQVKAYYSREFMPRFLQNDPENPHRDFFPVDSRSVYFQHTYLADNPLPVGSKHLMTKPAVEKNDYDVLHGKYHPFFRNILEQYGYYDIFLVDNSGYIVYTVFKETDFATSLLTGPHAGSNIAGVYKMVKESTDTKMAKLVDYEEYAPSYSAPASFMACPVMGAQGRLGTLIVQLPSDKINSVMTGNQKWTDQGLGDTGESYLLASDGTLRSDSRMLISNPEEFKAKLTEKGTDAKKIDRMLKLGTCILVNKIQSRVSDDLKKGLAGTKVTDSYLGISVLSSYEPLEIMGLKWGVVVQISTDEVFEGIDKFKYMMPVMLALLSVVAFVLGTWQSRIISRPLMAAKDDIEKMSKGLLPDIKDEGRKDEVGQIVTSVSSLAQNLKNAAEFALAVGNGRFDTPFETAGKDDVLGNALLTMRQNLYELDRERNRRNFINEGLSKFSSLLRSDSSGTGPDFDQLLAFIIKCTDANQGGLFVRKDEGNAQVLIMKACYAYNRKKFFEKEVFVGEGLLGQCVLEKEMIYMTEIPEGYTTITSGLGDAGPKALLIYPLLLNDEVHGVLELAAFAPFEKHIIELVKGFAELLASAVASENTNYKIRTMLHENQSIVEQLRAQEEELRQNMEEIQATQEEMKRRERELKKKEESQKA